LSRSYKKPYYTDQQNGCTRDIKRIAARSIRTIPQDETPQSGKSYRKVFDPWNIRDWSFHAPKDKKAYRK
jgi:hypothetical protein